MDYGIIFMTDAFIISLDRLKDGAVQKINASFPPDFLDVHEAELSFDDAVMVSGEAYIADEELVLHLNASTAAQMPCCICNQWVSLPLTIKGFYHTEPISGIEGPFFDIRTALREALLLELPKVVECKGNCPERQTIAPFLCRKTKTDASTKYFPFNDLKLP